MGFNSDGIWQPDSPLGITLGSPVKANYNTQFQTGINTDANAAAAGVVPAQSAPNSVLLNNGNKGLAETGWTDTVAGWFRPEGDKGTSVGGNIMNAVGTGVNAATGLAGMYFAKKNYDLQKDQANYLKDREAQSDARKSRFAANAGNNASY